MNRALKNCCTVLHSVVCWVDIDSVFLFSAEGPRYDLEYSGHGYDVSTAGGPATWTNMADVCAELGMQLVYFETNEEYEAVRDYILPGMYMYNYEECVNN